jgi:hypothetical protein
MERLNVPKTRIETMTETQITITSKVHGEALRTNDN